MLSTNEIKALIDKDVLQDADVTRVGLVSYDLRNKEFYRNDEVLEEVVLEPGGSAFVGAVECIALPLDLVARIGLKNSRLRQGLTLDAPVYFPGHSTRAFFRVTNISADEIELTVGHDLAQVFFERLDTPVESGYSGSFANEFSFVGVGDYKDVYAAETRRVQRETEKLENVEQRVYGNVTAIMGVFIALFTLVSVDISWLNGTQHEIKQLLSINLSVVGGMAALVGLVSTVLGSHNVKKLPWVVSVVAFVVAIALALV